MKFPTSYLYVCASLQLTVFRSIYTLKWYNLVLFGPIVTRIPYHVVLDENGIRPRGLGPNLTQTANRSLV